MSEGEVALEDVLKAVEESVTRYGEVRVKLFYRQDIGFIVFVYRGRVLAQGVLSLQEGEELMKELSSKYSEAVIDSDEAGPIASGQEVTLLIRPKAEAATLLT